MGNSPDAKIIASGLFTLTGDWCAGVNQPAVV